jgi:hypothetical protein
MAALKLYPTQIEDLLAVRNGFASVADFENLYEDLFAHFMADMPYGTAKARDGDPVEWLDEKIGTMTADEYADFVAEAQA